MSVRNKLIVHYIFQMIIIAVILISIIVISVFLLLHKFDELMMSRDFPSSGLHQLAQSMKVVDGRIVFDPKLLEQLEDTGGWLQVLDEEGEVIDSYFTPEDVPHRYSIGELYGYWNRTIYFPYDLSVWIEKTKWGDAFLLYGVQKESTKLLTETLKHSILDDQTNTLAVSEGLEKQIKSVGAWIQVLDDKGSEVAAYRKPADVPSQYKNHELFLRSSYSYRYGTELAASYDKNTGYTWVIQVPWSGLSARDSQPTEAQLLIRYGIGVLLVIFLLLIVGSFWYGIRFGTPLLHMMDWLNGLKDGKYLEPTNRLNQPKSKNKKGKLKRRYKVYAGLIHSLNHLSETLKHNEELQQTTEKLREDWISGVTHDLKTPLSTIKGYAHLLESNQYEWGAEEIREFGSIITEKSEYMDQLIEELSLIYRLKNDAVAVQVEEIEINQFLSGILQSFTKNPKHEGYEIAYDMDNADSKHDYVQTDPVWLRRIMYNILSNAIHHNDAGTHIQVSFQRIDDNQYRIEIVDDGQGMDEDTMRNLFERYFRGTHTEATTDGSGLGMAITKQLVEYLGGSIQVRSKLGSGTKIQLDFTDMYHSS